MAIAGRHANERKTIKIKNSGTCYKKEDKN